MPGFNTTHYSHRPLEEGSVAYWLQHNALLPQTVGGRKHTTLTLTPCITHTDSQRLSEDSSHFDTVVGKACVAYLPCCHGWHSIIDRMTSCRQYSIGSWLLSLILYSRLVRLSWVLSAPIVTGISMLSSSFWLDEKTVYVVDSYIT